ncbi:Adenylate cyclase 1 [Oceanibacterium hippocampi]|uniref:Adenylate cyclase 1 n=2 Tax=Oceanibacterium hippocampi TaxID=745714 RepID=A0A1Y5RM43_9PROT|nr:Adenylate cyclase 1 [Oceanibacterium hippocampi]
MHARDHRSIENWLIGNDGEIFGAATLDALCRRLIAAGVPVSRASIGLLAMHPETFASNLLWHRENGSETVTRSHAIATSDVYLKSPVYIIHQGVDSIRRRLDIENPQLDFPLLTELLAEGATDYVAMPLRFRNGQINYISWVSDRAGGFSTANLALLYGLLPAIALRAELYSAYELSHDLMNTYIGRRAADRVLSGTFRRAMGERIEAALLLCDLRGFTAMSERLPMEEVIETLDDYFDCMARPVAQNGGEILKFIGDGMLAMFPRDDASQTLGAPCRATASALAALEELDALNRRRAENDKSPLKTGIALHTGTVFFGNVGAAHRLDFTAIGPAVNAVARIGALCPRLERPILASGRFAAQCRAFRMQSVGSHVLRGIREPEELFAPHGAQVSSSIS